METDTDAPKHCEAYVGIEQLPLSRIRSLIDSGASDSLIGKAFVNEHRLTTQELETPATLSLLDGSDSGTMITHCLPTTVKLPTLEPYHLNLLVTDLDPNFSIVIGHDYLAKVNPLINWQSGDIRPRPTAHAAVARAVDYILPPRSQDIRRAAERARSRMQPYSSSSPRRERASIFHDPSSDQTFGSLASSFSGMDILATVASSSADNDGDSVRSREVAPPRFRQSFERTTGFKASTNWPPNNEELLFPSDEDWDSECTADLEQIRSLLPPEYQATRKSSSSQRRISSRRIGRAIIG
jgi:hypothetical protein